MTDKAKEYMIEIFGENYTEENAKNLAAFLRVIANGTVKLVMDVDANNAPYYLPMCSYVRLIEIANEFYVNEEVQPIEQTEEVSEEVNFSDVDV